MARSPPLFGNTQVNDRLWHIAGNPLTEVNEQLINGRKGISFRRQFASTPP